MLSIQLISRKIGWWFNVGGLLFHALNPFQSKIPAIEYMYTFIYSSTHTNLYTHSTTTESANINHQPPEFQGTRRFGTNFREAVAWTVSRGSCPQDAEQEVLWHTSWTRSRNECIRMMKYDEIAVYNDNIMTYDDHFSFGLANLLSVASEKL